MAGPRRLPVALAICCAGCLAVALAACGDDGDETTVTETEVVEETGSETPAETQEKTEPATTAETTEPQPPDAPGTQGPDLFASPTGNIACSIGAKYVRCDIGEKSWKPTPPEQPCPVDYGNGIQLDSRGASFVCAGDTTLGADAVLGYGERAQRGLFFCDSAEEGITCSNLETGAGFFISRDSYRIF